MSGDNIRVAVRFRNNSTDGDNAVEVFDGRQIRIRSKAMKAQGRRKVDYSFDYVWEENSTQEEIFGTMGEPLLKNIFEGYNSTLFVYGQTGSGKTYTMFGPDGGDMKKPEQQGIVPRLMQGMFRIIEQLERLKQDTNTKYEVNIGVQDIYLEKVRDLLNERVKRKGDPSTNLKVRWAKKLGVYVTYPDDRNRLATEVPVHSTRDVLDVISNAMKVRRDTGAQASTSMNQYSSRSHLVVTVKLIERSSAGIKTSKLLLIDLAGSEKVRNTKATGTQLQQAQKINFGLSVLGNVLNALTLTGKHQRQPPFQESSLTRMLKDSLGGNCKTSLICGCRPDDLFAAETKSTVMFGSNAKKIKNKAVKNQTLTVAEYKRRFKLFEKKLADIETSLQITEAAYEQEERLAAVLEKRMVEMDPSFDVEQFAKEHDVFTRVQIDEQLRRAKSDDEKTGEGEGEIGQILLSAAGGRHTKSRSMFVPGTTGSLSGPGFPDVVRKARLHQHAKMIQAVEEYKEDLEDVRGQLRAANQEIEYLQGQNDDFFTSQEKWRRNEAELKQLKGKEWHTQKEMENLRAKIEYLECHKSSKNQELSALGKGIRQEAFALELAESKRKLQSIHKALEEGRTEDVVEIVTSLVVQTKEIEKLKRALGASQRQYQNLEALQERERQTRKHNETHILNIASKYKLEKSEWECDIGKSNQQIRSLQEQLEVMREQRDRAQHQLRQNERGSVSEVRRSLKQNREEFFKYIRAANMEKRLSGKSSRRAPKRRKRKPNTLPPQLHLSFKDIMNGPATGVNGLETAQIMRTAVSPCTPASAV